MPSVADFLRQIAQAEPAVLRDDVIFLKTRLGRDESRRTDSTIPRRLRMLLSLVDGRRSVIDLRFALHSYRGIDDALDMLHRMGFIEPLPERWDLG